MVLAVTPTDPKAPRNTTVLNLGGAFGGTDSGGSDTDGVDYATIGLSVLGGIFSGTKVGAEVAKVVTPAGTVPAAQTIAQSNPPRNGAPVEQPSTLFGLRPALTALETFVKTPLGIIAGVVVVVALGAWLLLHKK